MAGLRNFKDRFIRFFSSLKLAVILLIIMAAISVVGTFVPQGQEPPVYIQRYGQAAYERLKFFGIIDLYHSWGFRALITLLAANLLVCSVRRLKGRLRQTFSPVIERPEGSIREMKVHNELPAPEKAGLLIEAFSQKRYRIRRDGSSVYASKGVAGAWGDLITHVSILVILLGALVGSLGFVGTVNIYEGDWSDQFYNWNRGGDQPFGFSLYVDELTVQHYPVEAKIEVRERESGKKTGVFSLKEGGRLTLPGTHYSLELESVDNERDEAVLDIYNDDYLLGIYNTGLPDGGQQAPPLFYYSFYLNSVGQQVLKNVASAVRIVKDGRLEKRGIIEVNDPLRYGGLTIYQTAYARDGKGRYYSGFQVVRDPGVPLVWAGFALLIIGLFLSFFVFHREVWVHVGEDRITIGGASSKDMAGFMREYSGIVKEFMLEVEEP